MRFSKIFIRSLLPSAFNFLIYPVCLTEPDAIFSKENFNIPSKKFKVQNLYYQTSISKNYLDNSAYVFITTKVKHFLDFLG